MLCLFFAGVCLLVITMRAYLKAEVKTMCFSALALGLLMFYIGLIK